MPATSTSCREEWSFLVIAEWTRLEDRLGSGKPLQVEGHHYCVNVGCTQWILYSARISLSLRLMGIHVHPDSLCTNDTSVGVDVYDLAFRYKHQTCAARLSKTPSSICAVATNGPQRRPAWSRRTNINATHLKCQGIAAPKAIIITHRMVRSVQR